MGKTQTHLRIYNMFRLQFRLLLRSHISMTKLLRVYAAATAFVLCASAALLPLKVNLLHIPTEDGGVTKKKVPVTVIDGGGCTLMPGLIEGHGSLANERFLNCGYREQQQLGTACDPGQLTWRRLL